MTVYLVACWRVIIVVSLKTIESCTIIIYRLAKTTLLCNRRMRGTEKGGGGITRTDVRKSCCLLLSKIIRAVGASKKVVGLIESENIILLFLASSMYYR